MAFVLRTRFNHERHEKIREFGGFPTFFVSGMKSFSHKVTKNTKGGMIFFVSFAALCEIYYLFQVPYSRRKNFSPSVPCIFLYQA